MATLPVKRSRDIIDRAAADPLKQLAQNACTRGDHAEVMANRDRTTSYDNIYAVKVEPAQKATSQKASGRCWMFAALNVCRVPMIRKYNLPDTFEFSQSYTFFWDKVERANYFLEAMIQLVDEPVDGRLVNHLLQSPLNDGGQWDMFVAVVQKYGLCPKSVFPETWTSSNSRRMNWILTHKLRGWAAELREAPAAERQPMKAKFLEEFIGVLVVCLGTPPKSFDWTFEDKDKKHCAFRGLTPLSFLTDHVNAAGFDFTEWVSLINDPRNEYGKSYTVNKLGNVIGGPDVTYINVDIEKLRSYTQLQLDRNEPVWFGCDVGKHFNRSMAVMDTKLYDFKLVYGVEPSMDKKTRLLYNDSLMTHAMVFTGYDKDGDGAITKWLVENSWGDGSGNGAGAGDPYGLNCNKGFYLMSNEWFDEYMYQIIVKKGDLEPELAAVLAEPPTVLPAWDPMGALAVCSSPDVIEAL